MTWHYEETTIASSEIPKNVPADQANALRLVVRHILASAVADLEAEADRPGDREFLRLLRREIREK